MTYHGRNMYFTCYQTVSHVGHERKVFVLKYNPVFIFYFTAETHEGKGRLYKPTSKLAELASTFQSTKETKKNHNEDRQVSTIV